MLKIALTNLEKYNEGDLVFEWVDLPCDDFTGVLDRIGNPEEYFISDYECEIPHVVVHEYDNLERLNKLAEELENLASYHVKALIAIMETDCLDVADALEIIRNDRFFYYETDSFDDFIDMAIENGALGYIPDSAKEFLDYKKLRDYFEHTGHTMTSTGVIYTD